jgi:sugar phosphate isomerase/epimerase
MYSDGVRWLADYAACWWLVDAVARWQVEGKVKAEPLQLSPGSVMFRAVGYGHGEQLWMDIVKAYMDVGFQGILSIENEDPILPGEVGVERAAYVLKNVRDELLASKT